jgi:uncharacterized RDD family membrane protein YckC
MAATAPAEHRVTAAPVPYAGVATRGVALTIDAALSQGLFVVGAALLGLIGSLVGDLGSDLVVGGVLSGGWGLTMVCYFAGFWALAGQTPGMRLMHVRVVARDGRAPSFGRALVRVVGLVLSIIPLFAGFLPALLDDRRRGLADFLAGTVVLYADRELALAVVEAEQAELALPGDMSGQPG